jgi:hypothetical protein
LIVKVVEDLVERISKVEYSPSVFLFAQKSTNQTIKNIMKKTLTFSILVAVGTCLSAQNLYVQPIGGGQQIAFSIASKPKITFNNRAMTVNQSTFQLNNVQNLSFTYNPNSSNIAMNLEDDKIRLFPNPVKDELTLNIQIPTQGLSYQVFDMTGKQLKTENINSETSIINMQNFQGGVYILKLIQSGQEIQSFKIVKQ